MTILMNSVLLPALTFNMYIPASRLSREITILPLPEAKALSIETSLEPNWLNNSRCTNKAFSRLNSTIVH